MASTALNLILKGKGSNNSVVLSQQRYIFLFLAGFCSTAWAAKSSATRWASFIFTVSLTVLGKSADIFCKGPSTARSPANRMGHQTSHAPQNSGNLLIQRDPTLQEFQARVIQLPFGRGIRHQQHTLAFLLFYNLSSRGVLFVTATSK